MPIAMRVPVWYAEKEVKVMFQGFSDAAIDFLWGVRLNNERGWFLQHKEEYQRYVYQPMRALAEDVFARMDGAHPEIGFFCKVARIYRDARRLHGQGPYRDHLWFCLRGAGEQWHDHPVFWFELTPEEWSSGLGFYCAQASTMAKFRARLDREPEKAAALLKGLEGQREFALAGPAYARAKAAPLPELAAWYNKKNFSFEHVESISPVLYDSGLTDRLCAGMELLLPLYRFLATVAGDPEPQGHGV